MTTVSEDVTPAELSSRLADEIERVVDDLKIKVARRKGRSLICFAPWSNHHSPKLYIDQQKKPGAWIDFVEDRTGDALGLVGCVLTDQPDQRQPKARSEAVKWARDRYGVGRSDWDRAEWQRQVAAAKARQAERDRIAAAQLVRDRRRAWAMWLGAAPLTPDTLGWRYLRERAIDLGDLPRRPRAVRFSPSQPYYWEGQVRHTGPALMAAMIQGDGAFGSLHRTWLNPDRPGDKADLVHIANDAKPRKMWPSSEGCAIRLWRGGSNLKEADAEARAGFAEDVVVGEGVEDGFSAALMAPELRIHAAGSLSGLRSYTPPAFTRRLILLKDNDWGKPQAAASFDRSCRRFREDFGLPVFFASSPEGKDFNDLLRGE